MSKRSCVAAGVFLLSAAACKRDEDDRVTLPDLGLRAAELRITSTAETVRVRAELATNEAQRTTGLMERRSLADTSGMLFVYQTDQPADAAFWMYRTRIPLDIAYLDSAGVIRAIVAMLPCPAVLAQGCPTYPAGVPFRAALEVNRGYFDRHRLAVGDRILLVDTAAARSLIRP